MESRPGSANDLSSEYRVMPKPLILLSLVAFTPAWLGAQTIPMPLLNARPLASALMGGQELRFKGLAISMREVRSPNEASHAVRDGALIGAAIGVTAGVIGGAFVGTGCQTSTSSCSTTSKRIGFMAGFGVEGGLAGAILGAIVGKVVSAVTP